MYILKAIKVAATMSVGEITNVYVETYHSVQYQLLVWSSIAYLRMPWQPFEIITTNLL